MSFRKYFENKQYEKLSTLSIIHKFSSPKCVSSIIVCCRKYQLKHYLKMGMNPILITDIKIDDKLLDYNWPKDNDYFFLNGYNEYSNCQFILKLKKKYRKLIDRLFKNDNYYVLDEWDFFNEHGYDNFIIFKEGFDKHYLGGLESIKKYSKPLDKCTIVICVSKKTKHKYLEEGIDACLIIEILKHNLENYYWASEDDNLFDEDLYRSHVKHIMSENL